MTAVPDLAIETLGLTKSFGKFRAVDGIDLDEPKATPIGAGCRVCERANCPQRAFPPIGRALLIDQDRSAATPYPTAVA